MVENNHGDIQRGKQTVPRACAAATDCSSEVKEEYAAETAGSAGEVHPDEDLEKFLRPAERRPEEFLTEWLRRLGRR